MNEPTDYPDDGEDARKYSHGEPANNVDVNYPVSSPPDEPLDMEVEKFKAQHLHLSPALRKLAQAAEKEVQEEDDESDYDDNLLGQVPLEGDELEGLTLEQAERLFKEITTRCDEGAGPGNPSPARAAAACLLLEQLAAAYPQYITILTAVSDIILKSVYVPDNADMRHLLGNVRRPIKLPPDIASEYGKLLRPYARKTYSEAHAQLNEGLISHARANRNIELRLTRQTNIFERTVKHWSASVLRNHFIVWRQHTRRRKQIREKYRMVFGRMRTDECRTKAIRAWRDRAAKMKRLAMFDTASTAELEGIQGSTSKMNEQIGSLQELNSNLSAQIVELERDRQLLQAEISAKERVVVELSLRARDMARVGTQLLDSAIVRRPPPSGNSPIDSLIEWASQMIESAGGMLDGQRNVLRPLRVSEESFGIASSSSLGNNAQQPAGLNIPLPALGLVMLGFSDERKPSRDQIVMLHTLKDQRQVSKELVLMCSRLIGAPSLVTAEQLYTRQRPMILLYLASLMRHYTNYALNKPLANVGGEIAPILLKEPSSPNVSPKARLRPTFSDQTNPEASDHKTSETEAHNNNRGGTAVGGFLQEEEDPEDQAAEAVGLWAERVTYQQQWITTSMAALHSVLELTLQKPVQLSSEEQEDLGKFYNIPMHKLSDLLPEGVSDTFYVNFFRSLTSIYPDLRKVYTAYATPTLSYHDLVRLLKDCKLLGPKRFQRPQIVQLMLDTLEVDPTTLPQRQKNDSPSSQRLRGPSSSPEQQSRPSTEDYSHLELSPAAFTETIIRLSLYHSRKIQRNPSLMLDSSRIVSNFVLENIVPNALRSDVDRFKHIFRHPLVQQVIAKHKIGLRRAFHRYASEDDGEGIPLNQFQKMARDCHWYGRNINDEVLADVFKRCQQYNGGSFETLDLYEWLEAICAIAIYDNPSPLIPLHLKLSPFVEERVLPIVVS